ncbi:MAG: hypothetical protein M0Q94_07710 [Candidatus Cloacimonetes bacterium]|nr:hypothetical protein [Candidatus Cloacimonadota bacterium]
MEEKNEADEDRIGEMRDVQQEHHAQGQEEPLLQAGQAKQFQSRRLVL